MTKVFISYVRENREAVQRLADQLTAGGLDVWFDLKDLSPGVRWKDEIRRGIRAGGFFLACFSPEYHARDSTHMNEEITIAIEELRRRHTDRPWLIPVLLGPCDIPDRSIGGGETLQDLQAVRLYEDWAGGVLSLLKEMRANQASPEDFIVPTQSFTYLKPENGASFATFCLKVFRVHLDLPQLAAVAFSDHSQSGVDLVYLTPGGNIGIECKFKSTGTSMTVPAMNQAIELAKTFHPPLNEFYIVTTADSDPALQLHAARIGQAHKDEGLFDVYIYAWQDIEEILKENPNLAADLYSTPHVSASTVHAAPDMVTNYQVVGGDFHAEIDEAARHITEGKPDVALALLDKLKRNRWDILKPRERFRVLANLGNGYLRKGDERGAALAFLEAATYQPQDDDQALSIAAHGHLLSGNTEKAYVLASESCSRNPMNERAQIVRLQSTPEDLPYGELINSVPDVLRSNPNIALSLAERAMKANNPGEAERVLRQVKDASPTLHFSLGAALLQQGLPAGLQEGMLLLPSNPDLVREARSHFTETISSQDSPAGLIAAAYFNRGLASSLLKDENQALADFRSAYEREPSDENFGVAFIMEALRRGEVTSALNAARELFKNNPIPRNRLLLTMALSESGGDEERKQILPLLQEGLSDLDHESPEVRIEYLRRTAYSIYLSGALTDETAKTLEDCAAESVERGIIRSWALLWMDQQDEAKIEAKETATLLNDTNNLALRREMAMLLSRLQLAEQAFPIWLSICTPLVFNEDTVHLLQAAERLSKDDEILDYCQRLRANHIYAPEAAEMEMEILVRYNELRIAQAVLREYLDASPGNLPLRLALLSVAVVQGWSEIVDTYMTSYPTAQEIKTVVDGARLVQILNFKGMTQTASEIAYELVRQYPDDPNSHRALIISILGFGGSKKDLNLEAPSEVIVGSAVAIRRPGEDGLQWIVIEDSDKPEVSRDEFPPDHALAQALIGKKVGESVTLPVSFVRAQTAVVVEIKHKILFRMHQSMEQMNQRFPGKSFFDNVKIGDESLPEEHQFDELLDLHRQLAQGPMEAERLYNERRIPVAALASIANNGDIPRVLEYLAFSQRHAVHCVDGRAEEFKRANFVIGSARAVVLDLTALSTIKILARDFDLSKMTVRCIVSEGTLERLRQRGKSLVEDPRVSLFMNYDGEHDRLIVQEIDPAAERERAAQATEYADKIESLCEVVGGRSLARIEPMTRDTLVRVFGSATAESIAIAMDRNSPLWSDDYATGIYIRSELSLQRVWTQTVCFWLRDAGVMEQRRM